jgi:beta-aspartyl-peptidase (threonine type)
MKKTTHLHCVGLASVAAVSFLLNTPAMADDTSAKPKFGLAIHGGAGAHSRDLEADYKAGLERALDAGYAILEAGGTSLDAVIAATVVLEDDPVFNAGRGAVFNADGFCELDASIMDGRNRAAGAVAGLRTVKNPIRLAREVMERSGHVMLIGDGAERFAEAAGLELVPNEYFQTERRRLQLERARQSALLPGGDPGPRFGTVGCVALDQHGNLAAATSTGGRNNKKFGRVGDVPVIGAGNYASNATCAVSATGEGEYFIRAAAAHSIAARMEHRGQPLKDAATDVILDVGSLGGTGGVITIDRQGNIITRFNTASMCRAHRLSTGEQVIAVFEENDERLEFKND